MHMGSSRVTGPPMAAETTAPPRRSTQGSCGSGTIACAVAESAGLADGLFEQDYFQPAGVVRASIERRGGATIC